MNALFKDLQILDLSTVLAGPSVATFFAELGATVIKVENPNNGGDVTRSWKLKSEDTTSDISAYFCAVNYNKQYRKLDLGSADHRPELEALIVQSDIVIVNFKHGDDVKFELTAADVHRLQPQAIYASLHGFASDPRRVAYDVVLQAESGHMYMNGNAQSGPLKMPVAMIDVIAAHQLKEGILCGLIARERNGKGCKVSCSLEQAALTALVNQATNFLMAGHLPQASGSLHPNIAPYGETMPCADGKHIVLAVGSDAQFKTLCKILSCDDAASDPRFLSNQLRVNNRSDLFSILSKAFLQESSTHWMSLLIAGNVPAGAVKNMAEVMETRAAQSMLLKEIIDGKETTRLSGVAFTVEF